MFDVLGLGELLIDFTPTERTMTYQANPGGAVANVLAMMSRLGCKSAFIGKIGDDEFGRFLAKSLQEFEVDISSLVWSKKYPTTVAFVDRTDEGEAFRFYRNRTADVTLKPVQVDEQKLIDTRLFHFGSVSLTEEPSRSATLMALEFAKKSGCLVSFDPNYRASLWTSPQAAISEILHVLPQVDIIKLSQEELHFLTGETDPSVATNKLLSLGPKLALITLGSAGSAYYTDKVNGMVGAPEVEVIDTVGAGDVFLGAFLAKLLNGNVRLDELTSEILDRWLAFANQAAALSTTRTGAMSSLPTKAEIENW